MSKVRFKGDSNIATSLQIKYEDTVDINFIHKTMLENFCNIEKSLTCIEDEIKTLKSTKDTYLRTIQHKKRITELENLLKLYSDKTRKVRYEEESAQILEEYNKCLSARNVMSATTRLKKSKTNSNQKLNIISRYIHILEKYLHVIVYNKYNSTFRCIVCKETYNENYKTVDGGAYTCSCGMHQNIISNESMNSNENGIPLSPVNEDKNNFTDVINRYCGIPKNTVTLDHVYEQFDEYLSKSRRMTGKELRSLPVKKSKYIERIGNKNGTSVNMVVSMLKDTGNTSYYDHINYIGGIYFGWIMPDLSKWKESILLIHNLAKRNYNKFDNKRSGILNGNVILYLICEFLHIPCVKEDFKMVDTKESFDNYREIWLRMCDCIEVKEAKERIFRAFNIEEKKKITIKM